MNVRWHGNTTSWLVVGMAMVIVVAGVGSVTAESTAGVASQAKRIFITGPTAAEDLQKVIVGGGIEGTARPALQGAEGEVRWETDRDWVDELGMRHAVYKQVLRPSSRLTALLGAEHAGRGIDLEGSAIGLHWEDGAIYAVYGYQFESFSLASWPAVLKPSDALKLAHDGLKGRKDFEAEDWLTWAPEHVTLYIKATSLLIEPVGGGVFRLVWQVPVRERGTGSPYLARLDASTGEVVSLSSQSLNDNCRPNTGSAEVTGKVDPQNPAITVNRTVWARDASQRLPAWSHEGGRLGTSTIPPIEVFLQVWPSPPDYSSYACPSGAGTYDYGVLPLTTSAGYPMYSDTSTLLPGQGSAAGDALFFTYKVMNTLKTKFGRCGFAGNCSYRANIVMSHWAGAGLNLGKSNWQTDTTFMPKSGHPTDLFGEGIVVYLKASENWAASAAIDVIGHEWGHGVEQHSAKFSGTIAGQLQEGFADVLGYSVEWLNQSAGDDDQFEKAEWMFGEDRGPVPENPDDPRPYWRRVDEIDSLHDVKYHKDDDPSETDRWKRGNMLPTVLYMLSEGAQNPLVAAGSCNPATMPGCDTIVEPLGVETAAKILMRTLITYSVSSTVWADLPDLAKHSAFDLNKRCTEGYTAEYEQTATMEAFAAIGYPASGGYFTCHP